MVIYKKGEQRDPHKLAPPFPWKPDRYTGCLASRVQGWLCNHGVLSQCRKGFLQHSGVFEPNFVVRERLDAERTGGTDLCVASLNYADAFRSVAHNGLVDAVRGAGARDGFTSLYRDLYEGNTMQIFSAGGATAPTAIKAGIRHGCPLSGLLNMVLGPAIRAVQGREHEHKILTNADDLTPIGDQCS